MANHHATIHGIDREHRIRADPLVFVENLAFFRPPQSYHEWTRAGDAKTVYDGTSCTGESFIKESLSWYPRQFALFSPRFSLFWQPSFVFSQKSTSPDLVLSLWRPLPGSPLSILRVFFSRFRPIEMRYSIGWAAFHQRLLAGFTPMMYREEVLTHQLSVFRLYEDAGL
jgi:hypothetical protein